MASLGDRARTSITLMVDRHLSSGDAQKRIAAQARKHLAEIITSGQGSPHYNTTVDGAPGAAEETVRLDGGEIVYSFAKGRRIAAIRFALAYAKNAINPGGPYSNAWFLSVDGQPWVKPIDEIPASAMVMLVNFAPFARALEERGRTLGRGKRHVNAHPERMVTERARQATMAAFPGLDIERQYVTIPGGVGAKAMGWEIPYHLRLRGPNQGQAILYPAVLINGV